MSAKVCAHPNVNVCAIFYQCLHCTCQQVLQLPMCGTRTVYRLYKSACVAAAALMSMSVLEYLKDLRYSKETERSLSVTDLCRLSEPDSDFSPTLLILFLKAHHLHHWQHCCGSAINVEVGMWGTWRRMWSMLGVLAVFTPLHTRPIAV